MVRLHKSALSALAVLVLVTAGGCGGSSASPSGSPGPTASPAPATTGAAVSAAATPNPTDPDSIITQVIAGGTAVKSFHIKIELNGTLKAAALLEMGDDSVKSDVKLDGTTFEGDVDFTSETGHMSVTAPAMQIMGGIPIKGDLIYADGYLYYKTSGGAKYVKVALSAIGENLGVKVVVPSPGPSVLTSIQDEVTSIRQHLVADGATATFVGVEQVDGKDAYHVSLSMPVEKMNSDLAAAAAKASPTIPPDLKMDSATFDIWVYKGTDHLAKMQVSANSSWLGNISYISTVTNYDAPVTITVPAAGDVRAP